MWCYRRQFFYSSNLSFSCYTSGNIVEENADGVGGWGGSCTCPDGTVYQVGDNGDYCKSIACIGGISGVCNQSDGEWAGRKVTCAAPQGKWFVFKMVKLLILIVIRQIITKNVCF